MLVRYKQNKNDQKREKAGKAYSNRYRILRCDFQNLKMNIGKSDTKLSIPKFSGTTKDFNIWRQQFNAYVIKKGYSNLIKKAETAITENTDPVIATNEVNKNCELYADLVLLMNNENIRLISNKKNLSGVEAWKRILTIYDKHSTNEAINLETQLANIEYKDGTSLQTYLNNIDDYVGQLTDNYNFHYNDQQVICKILRGLPPTFKTFKTTYTTANSLAELSLFEFKTKLISYYDNDHQAEQTRRPVQSYFTNTNNSQQRHEWRDRNKRGRFQSKRNDYRNQNSNNNNNTNILCHNCGKAGHKIAQCWAKGGGQEGKAPWKNRNVKYNQRQEHAKVANESEIMFMMTDVETNDIQDTNEVEFVIDSGASKHMTNDITLFEDLINDNREVSVAVNDKRKAIHARGIGTMVFRIRVKDEILIIKCKDTLYIPQLSRNLISVGKLAKARINVNFLFRRIEIKGKPFIPILNEGNIFVIRGDRITENCWVRHCDLMLHTQDKLQNREYALATVSLQTWHNRLGHANYRTCRELPAFVQMMFLSNTKVVDCETCAISKARRKPFKGVFAKEEKRLATVYADLAGPIKPVSFTGCNYISGFIDNATRYETVYTIERKSDTIQTLKMFITEYNKNKEIKKLVTDGGGEYDNIETGDLLLEQNIEFEITPPYTPELNSIKERSWGMGLGMARCIINWAQLPLEFWCYAVKFAIYVKNRLPTKGNPGVDKTPFEMFEGFKPSLAKLRVFGCVCYVYQEKNKRDGKLDDRAKRGIFLGYPRHSSGFYIYIVDTFNVVISRNVDFRENMPGGSLLKEENQNNISSNPPDILESEVIPFTVPARIPPTTITEANENIEQEYNNGTNTTNREDTPVYDETQPYITSRGRISRPTGQWWNTKDTANIIYASQIDEPRSYNQAIDGPQSNEWKKAIEDEFKALFDNDTFKLTFLPKDRKAIGCTWAFKVKPDSQDRIEKFKARLCAQGFTQVEGVDYRETFAPVVRSNTTRVMAAICAVKGFKIYSYDVKSAYLNAPVDEEIYMKIPPGYHEYITKNKLDKLTQQYNSGMVLQLNKSLYGLKQSGRNWDQLFTKWLLGKQFSQSKVDPSLFFKIDFKLDNYIVISKYVDDLNLFTNDEKAKVQFEAALRDAFKITILGELNWSLGINIRQNNDNSISFQQTKYINNILDRYNMSDANPCITPMTLDKLTKDDCPKLGSKEQQDMKNVPYRHAIGSLLYVSTWTRPEISYAVQKCAAYVENPGMNHWTAIKRIMRYLKGTITDGITFKPDTSLILTGYCDADWGGDTDSRKSITGYIFKLGGGVITWRARKQPTVALSTAEAEYMSLSEATQEAIYLRQLLNELGYRQTEPTIIYIDNQSAIKIAENPVQHQRTKHIDIKHHFIRSSVEKKDIVLQYLPTNEMPADILTKSLPGPQFNKLKATIIN